jgi:hypothetical protein
LCLAGQAALSRPTISAAVLRLRGGFADLAPGALALINLELLRQLPARPSLPQAIEALGRLGVAAIAVRGRVEPNELPIACRLAQRWSCVLLQLPDSKEGAVSLVEAKVTTFLTSERVALRGGMGDVPEKGGDTSDVNSPVVDRS